MSLFPNRYAGTCITCSTKVPAQEGFAFKQNGRWVVSHNSDKCVPAAKVADVKAKNEDADRKELTVEGELYYPYNPEALPLLRSLPGGRWNADKKCRTVSLDAQDRMRLLEICDKLSVTVPDSLREIPTDDALEAARERALAARFVDKEGTEHKLYPFQVTGVEFLAIRERAILGDDMGLGKTVMALLAIDSDFGTVVVCPSAVKLNWAAEIKRWRPDLTPVVCKGRKGKAAFRLPAAGEVVIVNYEILPTWLNPVEVGTTERGYKIMAADLTPEQREALMNTIVIEDEAHRGKNYRTALHKRVRELGRVAYKTWLLTATPLLSRPTDLYGVLQMGLMDREVFGGWKGFVRCFQGAKAGYGGSYIWGEPLPEVPERMRRVMLRRMKDDVLKDLPAKTYTLATIEGDAKVRKMADDLWTEFGGMLEAGMLPPFEKISECRAKLSASRIPAMLSIVEDAEECGKPLVVFSAYKAPINALAEREGWRVITGDVSADERQEIVEEFQAGKLKGVGLTIAAGGVGLTLTHASNVLFVDLDWTPALNWQAEDRVRRIGQKAASIQIIRMVTDHPLDLRVHELLDQKIKLVQGAIENRVAAPQNVSGDKIEIKTETQESFDARTAAVREAAEAAERAAQERVLENIRGRVSGEWLAGERGKAKRKEVPLTADRVTMIHEALDYMLGLCDGAVVKDDAGFNKPDAGRARMLRLTGLDTEDAQRVAERMLSRYYRQLHERYPALFA